jgi:hypothetical protein
MFSATINIYPPFSVAVTKQNALFCQQNTHENKVIIKLNVTRHVTNHKADYGAELIALNLNIAALQLLLMLLHIARALITGSNSQAYEYRVQHYHQFHMQQEWLVHFMNYSERLQARSKHVTMGQR